MIILNETISISTFKNEEWLKWMEEEQIPFIKSTGLVNEVTIMQVLGQDESESLTYAVHIASLTESDFEAYSKIYFKDAVEKQKQKFEGHYNNFKTLLKVIL